jgi:hypothetical protein
MIKLTYTAICDLCKRECGEQTFDCSNYMKLAFPTPTLGVTYQLMGFCAEMCDDCAALIIQAKNKIMDEYREKLK